ncbi:MAG: hypothetical protein KatS3mg089_0820 [Patescibacteria group bacterium]|nr:MAG: hypothetical protein KatS3mg089_0820 [Patescibacteria group bacterium]
MSKKTFALIVILLILTIILLAIALFRSETPSSQPPTISRPTPSPTEKPVGNTTLRLSPNPVYPTIGTNSATTVAVEIDTGIDRVTGVQLEIAYDPRVLTNMEIKPGDFFSNPTVLPVGGINTKTGRITFAVVPSKIGESRTGKGTVALLTFIPSINAGVEQTRIEILEKSKVSVPPRDSIKSVLKSFEGTTVILSSPSAR